MRLVVDHAIKVIVVLFNGILHGTEGSPPWIRFRETFRMENDLHPVTDLRIIKDNTVQPFLTFVPASHGKQVAVGAVEAEIVLRTFQCIQDIAGSFHGRDQLFLLGRVIMQRLGMSLIPFTHGPPPHQCPRRHKR